MNDLPHIPGSGPDLSEAGPAARLLRAIEVLAQQGPMGHDALETALGISKSATWRLVRNLRDAGWVRTRLGGRIIELDAKIGETLSQANLSDADMTDICDALFETAATRPIYFDLQRLSQSGHVTLFETTRQRVDETAFAQSISEISELAILAAMSAAERAACLARYGPSGGLPFLMARYDDPLTGVGPLHDEAGALPGYGWEDGNDCLVVSVRGKTGEALAIRIAAKTTKARKPHLVSAFRALGSALRPHVQRYGKAGKSP